MKVRVLLVVSAGLVITALAAAVLIARTSSDASGSSPDRFVGSTPPGSFPMPHFALRSQDGSVLTSESLRGKVVALTFLDTKCTEACPIIAAEVASGWRLLSPEERRQAVAVAITTDPRDDTPASRRAFLRRHHAATTFRYLSGPIPVLKRVWREFLILSSLESGDASTHSAPVRVYGRDGTWLATLHAGVDLTPEGLAHDIRAALERD